jgi:hypothetical protein
MLRIGKEISLIVVAFCMCQNKVFDGVVLISRPWDEMIYLASGIQISGTIETLLSLQVGQEISSSRKRYAVLAEEEVLKPRNL